MSDAFCQSAIRNLQSAILAASTTIDAVAAALILAGILCQVLHRRMPPGLGTSLFVGATTVGALTAACTHDWPAAGDVYVVYRIMPVLCAVWAFFGWLAARGARLRAAAGPSRRQGSSLGNSRFAGRDSLFAIRDSRFAIRDLTPSATFFAWSLVTGVAAVVLTVLTLVFRTCSRLLDHDRLIETLSAGGLWNIIALLTATLFWTASAARRQQPVVALILAALAIWWTSLMIPSAVGTYRAGPGVLMPLQPIWWTWTFQMQFGLAALLLIAAVLQESGYRAQRRRSWPDRLDDLLTPYSRWPAYTQTEAVLAAAVLLLGVYHIVRPGPPSWELALANSGISLSTGTACLFMTYRRWSANTSGLGLALLTLAAVALACAMAAMFGTADGATEYVVRLPVVYTAVLYATAAMIALWYWCSRFWAQQLLDGVPWTTTGRMIPYAERTAYLLTALAVLVAFQMALWPRQALPSVEDDTPGRLVAGVLAFLLLAVITARNARLADSSAAATLGVAFLVGAVLFVFIRLPTSPLRGWISQHDAVCFGVLALPILLAAEWLPKTRWRCFSLPLWWMALLILPAGALMGLLVPRRLPADWVRPATFATLGILYVLAGRREHRRAMLVLGGVLLLAAATTVYDVYGPS